MLETQQQSDTTYRLYDYGRPRPLHLEHGLASVKERTASGKVIRPAPVVISGGKNRRSSMIAAPYFTVDLFELKEPQDFSTAEFEKDEFGQNFRANSGGRRRLRSCRGAGPRLGDTGQRRRGRDSRRSARFHGPSAVAVGVLESLRAECDRT